MTRLVLIVVAALGLAAPNLVSAQPAKKKKLTAAQKRKAKRFTLAGNKLKRQGDLLKRRKKITKAKAKYKRAVIAYSKAFAVNGSANLVFKLAGVYWARGELRWARRGYKRYIEMSPDGRYADRAVRAVKVLSDKIKEDLLEDEGDTDLEPTAVFGPDESKKPDPEPEPEPEPEPKPKKVVKKKPKKVKKKKKADKPRRPPPPGRNLRWAGIGASAAGLLSLAIGIKFGADASSAANDLSSNDDGWTEADRQRIADGESANNKFIAFTLIGTAAVIAGGALYVMGQRAAKKGRADRVTVSPTADQDSVGLVVWGRF